MGLPKIESPTYKCTLPTTNKEVSFRPFTAKEERILLIASETDSEKDIMQAIKDIISACSNGEVNPDELAAIDLEWFFVNLRAKSVGEVSEFKRVCGNELEESKCEAEIDYAVNLLDDIDIVNKENVEKKIEISETVGLVLKVPTLKMLTTISQSTESESQALYEMIAEAIDYTYDSEQVYKFADVPKQEG